MAFGKKKDEAGAPDLAAPEADGAIEPLFPANDGDDDDGETAAIEVAPPPVEPAPALAPNATDLLSMFQSTSGEETDRSVLVELSGDVDLADLLEELQTLAAAMGIQTAA